MKAVQPDSSPGQPQSPTQPEAFDFIVNPDKPVTKRAALPGANSLLGRVVLVAVGIIILVIAFNIVKTLVSGSSNLPSMVTVAQDQQELVHLATAAAQQQNLSVTDKNFIATAQLSLASAQSKLLAYLKTNKAKVTAKVLNLKVSAATDSQLTAAQTAATYGQTLHDIMKAKLNGYATDLKRSYQQTKGTHGRALLSDAYDQGQLLLIQLDTPAN